MSIKNGQISINNIILIVIFIGAILAGLFVLHLPFQTPLKILAIFGIFLIALLKTDLAIVLLILAMLLSPEFRLGGIPGRSIVIRIDDIFIFAIFFGWLAKVAINKELGLLKTTILNRPILIYIAISIVATLLGAVEGNVKIQHSFFYLLKYIEYFLIFFMVLNNMKSISQAKFFVFFLLLTCFLVSLYGWMSIGKIERLTAPFEGGAGEANTLAGYLLLMMGLILGLILYNSSIMQNIVLISLLGFTIPPFLFTLSRGTWLAFFPMYLSLAMLTKKRKGIIFLAFLLLIILLPVMMPQKVRERIIQTFVPGIPGGQTYVLLGRKMALDESAVSRVKSWGYAFKMWAKRPILGYGVPAGIVTDNQYARVLREVGTIGTIVYIWLMVTLFKVGWRSYRLTKGNNFAQGLSLGFMAAFIGLLTQAVSVETFIIVRIMEPFWLLTAIVITLPEIIISSQSASNQQNVAERLNV